MYTSLRSHLSTLTHTLFPRCYHVFVVLALVDVVCLLVHLLCLLLASGTMKTMGACKMQVQWDSFATGTVDLGALVGPKVQQVLEASSKRITELMAKIVRKKDMSPKAMIATGGR